MSSWPNSIDLYIRKQVKRGFNNLKVIMLEIHKYFGFPIQCFSFYILLFVEIVEVHFIIVKIGKNVVFHNCEYLIMAS